MERNPCDRQRFRHCFSMVSGQRSLHERGSSKVWKPVGVVFAYPKHEGGEAGGAARCREMLTMYPFCHTFFA